MEREHQIRQFLPLNERHAGETGLVGGSSQGYGGLGNTCLADETANQIVPSAERQPVIVGVRAQRVSELVTSGVVGQDRISHDRGQVSTIGACPSEIDHCAQWARDRQPCHQMPILLRQLANVELHVATASAAPPGDREFMNVRIDISQVLQQRGRTVGHHPYRSFVSEPITGQSFRLQGQPLGSNRILRSLRNSNQPVHTMPQP